MKCEDFCECYSKQPTNSASPYKKCEIGEKCLKYRDRRTQPVAGENKKVMRFVNKMKKEVACYRLDEGCVIKSDSSCDFLFMVTENKRAVFIECKSKNVEKAIKQVENSLEILKKDLHDFVLHGRIIGKRGVPSISREALEDLRKKFKKLGGDCRISENVDEDDVEKL